MGEIPFCKKVFAFERDSKRFKILEYRISKALESESNDRKISCLNLDFLEQDIPNLEKNDEIKFIVCDPSCSGSGMNLHNNGI